MARLTMARPSAASPAHATPCSSMCQGADTAAQWQQLTALTFHHCGSSATAHLPDGSTACYMQCTSGPPHAAPPHRVPVYREGAAVAVALQHLADQLLLRTLHRAQQARMQKLRRLAAQLQTVPEMCAVDGTPAAATRDARSPTKRQTGSTQHRAHQHHSILAADSNHGAAHSGEGTESVFEPPVTAQLQAEQHTNDRGSRAAAAAPPPHPLLSTAFCA